MRFTTVPASIHLRDYQGISASLPSCSLDAVERNAGEEPADAPEPADREEAGMVADTSVAESRVCRRAGYPWIPPGNPRLPYILMAYAAGAASPRQAIFPARLHPGYSFSEHQQRRGNSSNWRRLLGNHETLCLNQSKFAPCWRACQPLPTD